MKTAVVTDSNSGITRSQAEELGVFVLPMPFVINGEEFFEDINLTQDEFYERLDEGLSFITDKAISLKRTIESVRGMGVALIARI